ncbi:hypothetical protein [Paraburkholderia atlantica]|uniref:hypothetical protein n=1 Tax=Paraburkholderia atlantica TaxID=2654982 RepID=UPI0012FEB797|nr:hypothetical protein [Paraburkholderia atlantica]MBB5509315.1 Na+(H+)/acetate symporter ActP [Paraburkholderia atlantica]
MHVPEIDCASAQPFNPRLSAPTPTAALPRRRRRRLLISVPLAFVGIWTFSMLDRRAGAQREREAFTMQEFYGQTGLLPIKPVDH